jgi:2-methylcitrate dehydratase
LSAIGSTGLKFYPVNYNAQGPVYSALALRSQFRLDEVERITVSLHWDGWHAIGGGAGDREEKWNPSTRESADHSMAYAIAAALLDGELTVESFGELRIRDPRLQSLMQKIVVQEDPRLTREHAGELPRWPSRVDIALRDGRRISRESGLPKGHPLNPMSDAELEAKYRSMADRVLPPASGRRLLDTLWSLESLVDISVLTEQFRACGRASAVGRG